VGLSPLHLEALRVEEALRVGGQSNLGPELTVF
jgi:hypothetical protein